MPALELDGEFVPESLVTCDLLEERHPEPALYPADPWRKAHDRVLLELFTPVSPPVMTDLGIHLPTLGLTGDVKRNRHDSAARIG